MAHNWQHRIRYSEMLILLIILGQNVLVLIIQPNYIFTPISWPTKVGKYNTPNCIIELFNNIKKKTTPKSITCTRRCIHDYVILLNLPPCLPEYLLDTSLYILGLFSRSLGTLA